MNIIKAFKVNKYILLICICISIIIGLYISQISWGDSNSFHGKGIPFPTVCWDKSQLYNRDNSGFIDFVCPVGFALNIIFVFILLILVYYIYLLLIKIYRLVSKN
jgi:hypothetical protein